MKKLLWLCLLGCVLSSQAQELKILDAETQLPLGDVVLRSKASGNYAISNDQGWVDLSGFREGDTILLHLMGFNTQSFSYSQLTKLGTIGLSTSVVALDQVVVSSYTPEVQRNTSLQTVRLPRKKIAEFGSYSLTDALDNIPGVDQLSTGPGIAKPVIRGLYGHRILVLFSGLRFDNQQWQDEHGLGISNFGIARAEVIKGPLSMLYGTSANGGVINIIEEGEPRAGTSETTTGAELHSNTAGGLLSFGHAKNYGKRWFRLSAGLENHADYSDGRGDRVLNSRFNGYYLKSAYGFKKKAWNSENRYHFSYNNYGFIFSDISHFFEADPRWTRAMNGPHHIVMLNLLGSENTIRLKDSKLKLNLGLQSNFRAEDEGGSELSLVMHLLSGQYAAKWEKSLNNTWDLVVANNSTLESNANYGKRTIVPDAFMAESNLSAYLKQKLGQSIVEYGLGGGFRYINALPTKGVNSEEKEIEPFAQTRTFVNGMLGFTHNPAKHWNLKANLASGVRAPNLAELSSNGLHEGIYTYEIGDPEMQNEQNLNAELSVNYAGDRFQFGVSAFHNYFYNYIYLQPTEEEWFGFPVHRFTQRDAAIYGGEAKVSFTPLLLSGLELSTSFSGLIGELSNGTYLPFMPAQKLKPQIRYEWTGFKKGGSFYAFVNSSFVDRQERVNPQEAESQGYTLVNASAGFKFSVRHQDYDLSIAANNLLNEAYYDHLSRLKTYSLLNMGRDISINLKINFINSLK